ncbi:MAG TPA: VOC family protein [Gemmatimonadaceae bacterium]|nr:VOC family protein [Gemmatimonadaceae bacterium]
MAIFGAHFLIYSTDADADRAFLRDVLELSAVDVGRGWLIFALPPGEIAVHPGERTQPPNAEDAVTGVAIYLMCDDLESTMKSLRAKKVEFTRVVEAPWGTVTSFALPSGANVGLYQPKHPTAFKR